jgi:choline dehydrogenase-like flavoprotein
MLNEANMPYSQCVRCEDCDGLPCLVQAKSDAEVLGVRPALEHSNVTLLTNSQVLKLNTNAAGSSVSEVVVDRDGKTETFRASIVVVSAGAANSARLLLMSANDKHPHGLANGSGQVGRNYMYHNSQAVLAISKEPNPTKYQKTLGLNDFYFGMKDFEFPMGNIQMVGKSQGPMYKGEKPIEAGLAPMFTLDFVAKHAVDFWLSTEDLPSPDNRVTIDREGNITLSYTPNNQVAKQRLYEKLKSMLNHLGMHEHLIPRNLYMKNEIGIGGVAHQSGTCRFGTDPATSVLDTNCKAHELDNLYVVDTSFFPSIGAVNPALTAMANAIRVGDHLLERLK